MVPGAGPPGRECRSVQRQNGGNQHFEALPGYDGVGNSGRDHQRFSLGQICFRIADGEVGGTVHDLDESRPRSLMGMLTPLERNRARLVICPSR